MQDIEDIRYQLSSDKVTVRKKGRQLCEDLIAGRSFLKVLDQRCTFQILNGVMDYEEAEIKQIQGKKDKDLALDVPQFVRNVFKFCIRYGQLSGYKLIETLNIFNFHFNILYDKSLSHGVRNLHKQMLCDVLEVKISHAFPFQFLKKDQHECGSIKILIYLKETMIDIKSCSDAINLKLLKTFCQCLFHDLEGEVVSVFASMLEWLHLMITPCLADIHIEQHVVVITTIMECYTYMLVFQGMNVINVMIPFVKTFLQFAAKLMHQNIFRSSCCEVIFQFLFIFGHVVHLENSALANALLGMDELQASLSNICIFFLSDEFITSLMQQSSRYSTTNKRANKDCYANLLEDSKLKLYLVTAMMTLTLYERYYGGEVMKIDDRQAAENFDLLLSQPVAKRQRLEHASTSTTIATLTKMTTRSVVDKLLLIENQRRQSSVAHHGVKNESIRRMEMMLSEGHLWYVIVIVKDYVWTEQSAAHLYQWFYQFAALFEHFVTHTQSSTQDDIQFFGVMLLNISTFLEKFQCNKLRIQDKDAINQTIAVVIDLMIKCEGKVKDWTSRSSQVDQILKQFCLQLLQSSMLSALIQSKLLQMLSTWNYCTELTSFSYNLSLLCLMASHGGQLPIIHMNTKKATLDVEVILPTGEDHSADNHRKLNFLERYLDLAFSQCSDIKTMNNSSGQELLQVVQRVSKSMQILIASLVFGNYSISSKVISSDHAKPWIQSVYEELLCAKGYNVLLETHPDIQSNHLFKPREDLVTSLHDQAFDTALYEEVFQSLEICREKLCESLKSQSLIQEMHDGHLMLLQIATMLCEAYLFMFQLSVLIKNTSTLSPRDLELSLYKIVEACLKLCQSKFSGKNIPLLTTLLKLMASCFSKFPEVHFTSVNQENQQCKENCKKLLNALNQLVSGKQVSIAKDNHPEALYRTNTSIDLTADWEMSGPGNATSQANSTANMNMLDRDNFRGGGVVHSSEHLLTQALMQTYIMVLSSRIDSLQSQNLSITSLLDANIARNSSVCLQLMEELNILGFFPAAVELMEASSWHIDRGILGFRSILLTILHALQQESLLPEEIVEKCLMFLFPSENDAVLNQMYANFWLNRYLRVECIFAILRRIQQFQGIKSQLPNIFVEAFGDHDVRVNYLASSKCTLLIRAFKNPTKVYRSLVQSSAIEIFSPATSQYDGEIVPDNPLKVAILALSIARMCYGGSIDLVKTALYDLIVLCSTRTSSFCNTRDNSNIPTSLSQSIASPKAPLSSSQRERSKHASSLFHGLQQAILYEFAEGLQYQHPAYFVLEYMRYLLFRWMHDFAEHSLQTNTESIESCSQEKLTALVHQSMELFPFYLLDENHTFGHDNKVRSPVNASIERSRQHMLSKYRSFVLTTVLQYPHSRLRWLYFQQYCNILQLPINDHELASLCQKILCQGKVYELTVYYSGKWYLQNKEQAPSKQCFQRHEYIQQFFKSTLNDNDIRRIVEEQIPSLTLELFRSLCCEPIDAVEAIAFDNVKEGGKWLEMIVKQLLTMSGGSQSISDLLDQINILAIFAQLNSLLNSMHSSRVIYFTGVEIHFILTHGLATHVYSRPSVIYAMMTCLRNMVVHGQDKMEIVIETFELIVDLLVAQIASKQASKRVIAAIASELVLLHYFLDDVALRLNNDKPTWTNDVSQFLQKFYRFNPSNLFRSVGENHADPAIATAQVEYATTLSLKFLTLFQRIAHQYSDSYGGKQYFAEEIFTLPRVFQDISGTASSTSKASASANNIDSSDAISSDVLLRQTTRCLERYMQSQISLSQMWMQVLNLITFLFNQIFVYFVFFCVLDFVIR